MYKKSQTNDMIGYIREGRPRVLYGKMILTDGKFFEEFKKRKEYLTSHLNESDNSKDILEEIKNIDEILSYEDIYLKEYYEKYYGLEFIKNIEKQITIHLSEGVDSEEIFIELKNRLDRSRKIIKLLSNDD